MVDNSRLVELRLRGYCCSQIIMKMGLEDACREDNPGLIQAVRGLCDGMHSNMICGILTASACLISLLQPDNAEILINEIVEWFRDEYEKINGGITCEAILAGNPINLSIRCPRMLAATYDKVIELLEMNT